MKTFRLCTSALAFTTIKAKSKEDAVEKFNSMTKEQKLRRTEFLEIDFDGNDADEGYPESIEEID